MMVKRLITMMAKDERIPAVVKSESSQMLLPKRMKLMSAKMISRMRTGANAPPVLSNVLYLSVREKSM